VCLICGETPLEDNGISVGIEQSPWGDWWNLVIKRRAIGKWAAAESQTPINSCPICGRKLGGSTKEINFGLVDVAELLATVAHEGQYRKDGKPYITHPAAVVREVRIYKANSSRLDLYEIVGWLHDAVEDTLLTYFMIVQIFGWQVSHYISELTTNPEMKEGVGDKGRYLSFKFKKSHNLTLVVKLVDRKVNIGDTKGCDRSWYIRYTKETEYFMLYLLAEREKLNRTHKIIIHDILMIVCEKKAELGITETEGKEGDEMALSIKVADVVCAIIINNHDETGSPAPLLRVVLTENTSHTGLLEKGREFTEELKRANVGISFYGYDPVLEQILRAHMGIY